MYYNGMFCGAVLKYPHSSVIAVDLDATLAYGMVPYDPKRIGPPVLPMVLKVQRWLKQGKKVVILTARLNSKVHTPVQLKYTRRLIGAYTKRYVGQRLPSTAEKHPMMSQIYDDKAIQVIPNTGKVVKWKSKTKGKKRKSKP